jgi:hypothetical protein
MNLIDRVKNRIFKCNLGVSVDYHAGGFFVKKQVAYIIFTANNSALIYQREEGLHPNDNNSNNEILLSDVSNEKNEISYAVCQPNTNINVLQLSNNEKKILCMPSIFIENVNMIDLTEIVLDKFDVHTRIFNLVSIIDKNPVMRSD